MWQIEPARRAVPRCFVLLAKGEKVDAAERAASYLALLEHCAESSEATEPKGGGTMTDAKQCERCGPQKATKHHEFRYSGAWNVCASCAQKLIAFHATGGKPKRTRRQGKIKIIPGWSREKPLNPEGRTVKRSAGSRRWGPDEWARRAGEAA